MATPAVNEGRGYIVFVQRQVWQDGSIVVFDSSDKAAQAQVKGMIASGEVVHIGWDSISLPSNLDTSEIQVIGADRCN
jgi:hypothetical protein